MNLTAMRYGNYTWPSNPCDIKISMTRKMSHSFLPGKYELCDEIANGARVVKGEGVFAGENAYSEMMRLKYLFDTVHCAELYVPQLDVMDAYFVSLEIVGETKKDFVRYAFEFVEKVREKKKHQFFTTATVQKDENLFDVAHRTGVSIEEIARLNEIKDAFCVKEGDVVKIC